MLHRYLQLINLMHSMNADTLFSNIRTYFRKVWFAGFSGGASPDVLIFRSKNNSFLDPHFLYYLASNKTFIDYTDLTSKDAKMPRGDKDAIAKFPVKLPPLNEQKSIASVIGALDDKIENNRQVNETLEEMARAIFKSWFVDFAPVHAKAAGNAHAYMDADTAALFPSSFGDDGLPVGWSEVSAETISSITIGKTPSRKEHQWFSNSSDDIKWASIRDMGECGTYILQTSETLKTEAIEKFNVLCCTQKYCDSKL